MWTLVLLNPVADSVLSTKKKSYPYTILSPFEIFTFFFLNVSDNLIIKIPMPIFLNPIHT